MQETTVLFLMFTIILFSCFNTIFIHKKRFRGALPRDCSWNHNFSCYLIRGHKQVLIWNIRFLSFLYTQSFCKLTETSRVKSFSSCHTVFSVMQVLPSNFWAVMARVYLLLRHPWFIWGVFTFLNWQKFLFYHSSNWQTSDSSLFGNFARS